MTATDDSGATATDTFEVANPSIELSDDSVPVGGTTVVTGDGFLPGEVVTVTVADAGGTVIWTGQVVATEDGAIAVTVDVPLDAPAGAYMVVAEGADSGATASAPLEVIGVDPDITIVTPGAPGGQVHVEGDGFTPGGQVIFDIEGPDGQPIGQVITIADDEGHAAADIPIPLGAAPGTYTLTATDVETGFTDSAPVQIVPAVLTPRVGTPVLSSSGLGSLPRTGSDTASLTLTSALFVLGGLLAVLAARRRREGEA